MFNQIKAELIKTLAFLTKGEPETITETMSQVFTDSQIKVTEKAEGGKVELIDENGELKEIADGDYEMEDGSKFSVKAGLISKWEDKKEVEKNEDAEKKEEKMDADTPANQEALALKAQVEEQALAITELKETISKLQEAVDNYQNTEKELAENFSNQLNELNETIKQIVDLPAEGSKTNTKNIVADSREEKLFSIYKAIKK